MTQEIPTDDWVAFFQKFNDLNRGSLVTVEHENDGRNELLASDVPFEGFQFSQDACTDGIILQLAERPSERKLDHRVIDPVHVRIIAAEGNQKFIRIEAENGVTLVKFHNGRLPFDPRQMEAKQTLERAQGTGKERLAGIPGR